MGDGVWPKWTQHVKSIGKWWTHGRGVPNSRKTVDVSCGHPLNMSKIWKSYWWRFFLPNVCIFECKLIAQFITGKKSNFFSAIGKSTKSGKYIFTTDKSKITTSIVLYFLLFPLVEECLAWRSTLIAKQKLFCYFQDLFGLQLNIVYTTFRLNIIYTLTLYPQPMVVRDSLWYKIRITQNCVQYHHHCYVSRLWCDALNFSYIEFCLIKCENLASEQEERENMSSCAAVETEPFSLIQKGLFKALVCYYYFRANVDSTMELFFHSLCSCWTLIKVFANLS